MYGEKINDVQNQLRKEEKMLVVVGAEKVPREIYELADYNIVSVMKSVVNKDSLKNVQQSSEKNLFFLHEKIENPY